MRGEEKEEYKITHILTDKPGFDAERQGRKMESQSEPKHIPLLVWMP